MLFGGTGSCNTRITSVIDLECLAVGLGEGPAAGPAGPARGGFDTRTNDRSPLARYFYNFFLPVLRAPFSSAPTFFIHVDFHVVLALVHLRRRRSG